MIAWWAWILTWVGLGVALMAMLAAFSYSLFRKFLGLLDEFADLADRADIPQLDPVALSPLPLSVLADPREVAAREHTRLADRQQRREDRHAARLARAHTIGTVDITRTPWPAQWYRPARQYPPAH